MITEKQRKERLKGIGGSDMAAVLGISSYKTPYQLFLEKTELIEPTYEETPFQYWGNALEMVVRKEFRRRHRVQVRTPDTIVHPLYPYLRANVDGFIPKWNSVLEVKTSSGFMAKEWGEHGSDFIPMQYLVQVAHYALCTNADSAHIALLLGGNDYREYKYERRADIDEMIIVAAKAFWECVQNKVAPSPVDISDLKLLYPEPVPESIITCNGQTQIALDEIRALKQKVTELTKEQDKYKFTIMEYMGSNETLCDESGKTLATWKSNKNGVRTFRTSVK